jgi:aminopeptidase N
MKRLYFIIALALLLPWSSLIAQTAGDGIDVTHYEIHIWDFDFTNRTLQGETFVTFTTTSEVQQIVLELKSLTVTDVASDLYGIKSFSQEGDFLTIVLDEPMSAGETGTLDVRYGGSTFSETWGGVEWWGSDRVYNLGVGFESQPHNLGKAWFPCVDNFIDKATYDLYITTTNDKKAICGGNHVETIDNGDGSSTWHWNTPQEISTYHISFVVGDFVVWEDVYHGIERDIPIEVYTSPGLSGNVPNTFVHIHEIMSFFEENLGPYPFNRIGYIGTSKGCMEHTDNIALATSVISGNTANEEYLAHELSHMWSGNMVTCAEAGDMWLNEGFAQFWGAFYEVGVYGEEHFQNTISTLVNNINTWCNNSNNWIPLNNMPLDMTYDGTAIYDRGAVIVNTMMNYMGRENFLEAMRQYFDEYAYQTATSELLCEALTQYSGIDMHGFFDTYVYSSGMPHLYAAIKSVEQVDEWYDVTVELCYQHIGDGHIGQHNAYELTFIGPDFQLETARAVWDGLQYEATVSVGFEPIGVIGDFNNNWLDGKTQKNMMLKTTSQQNFAYFTAKPTTITDSVFVSVENHFIEPYDDPLIPYLTLSTKHFWTINRYDFGEAQVEGWFDYSKSNDGDIIQTQNDSATLLYRKNASEPWHEIAYTLYPSSNWKQGRFILDDFQSGEYVLAVWNKEALSTEEFEEVKSTMQVFPNPARNEVNVSWAELSDGQVSLCDMSGKVLKTLSFTKSDRLTLALDGLAAGHYLLTRKSIDGTPIETEILTIK